MSEIKGYWILRGHQRLGVWARLKFLFSAGEIAVAAYARGDAGVRSHEFAGNQVSEMDLALAELEPIMLEWRVDGPRFPRFPWARTEGEGVGVEVPRPPIR